MKTINPAKIAFTVLDIEKVFFALSKTRQNWQEWKKNGDKHLRKAISSIKDKKMKTAIEENIKIFQRGRTAEQIAKLSNINSHYIYDAKAVMAQEPKLKKFILSGQISLVDSKKILKAPSDLKHEILKKIYTGTDKKEIRVILALNKSDDTQKKDNIKWDSLRAKINSNIPRLQKEYLIGKTYNKYKASYGGNRRSSNYEILKNKAHEMAEILCVSCATINRAGKIANEIDKIKNYSPATAKKILSGKIKGVSRALLKMRNDIELVHYLNQVKKHLN